MFERFPSGGSIFLDANVLVYHVLEGRPSCAVLLRRAAAREIRAVTSPVVLGEVAHCLTLAETVQRWNLPSSKAALNLLRRHPEHLAACTIARTYIAQFLQSHVQVLPVRRRELVLAVDLSRRYHLLTNDALILATMTVHGLTHLATNDEDFRRVPHLTLWRP